MQSRILFSTYSIRADAADYVISVKRMLQVQAMYYCIHSFRIGVKQLKRKRNNNRKCRKQRFQTKGGPIFNRILIFRLNSRLRYNVTYINKTFVLCFLPSKFNDSHFPIHVFLPPFSPFVKPPAFSVFLLLSLYDCEKIKYIHKS